MTAVCVTDLRKEFLRRNGGRFRRERVPVLCDVSLRVRARRDLYGLWAANGSGKSTLIRMFSPRSSRPTRARCERVRSRHPRQDEDAVKRLINRVSVEASFFKKLSAMENLVYSARLYGVGTRMSRAGRRLRDPAPPRRGDMDLRQRATRAALARHAAEGRNRARLPHRSDGVLLLDEPTTGLDIRRASAKCRPVRAGPPRRGTTRRWLLTTHDLDEAERLSEPHRDPARRASREPKARPTSSVRRHGATALEEASSCPSPDGVWTRPMPRLRRRRSDDRHGRGQLTGLAYAFVEREIALSRKRYWGVGAKGLARLRHRDVALGRVHRPRAL